MTILKWLSEGAAVVGVWGVGARPCDAVFPATGICLGPGAIAACRPYIVLMWSQGGVTQVIELNAVSRFTPHFLRHTLKAVGAAV